MKVRISTLILLALCASAVFAQNAPFPSTVEKELAGRASNFTEVTLDKSMLAFASKFMDGKKAEDVQVRQMIQNLDAIYVRSYEFEKEAQFTAADLDAIRKQFPAPEWSAIVRSRSRAANNDTDVYVKLVNGEIHGMFVLNAEPKELDLVYISGPIRPEDFDKLKGNFGIPDISMDAAGSKAKGTSK